MLDLTFGEQVKIILSRKGMTIKELAEKIEKETGKKMSRQNLTQRLGRDNFQEQDMRMIAQILECPFYLDILEEHEGHEETEEEDRKIENLRHKKEAENTAENTVENVTDAAEKREQIQTELDEKADSDYVQETLFDYVWDKNAEDMQAKNVTEEGESVEEASVPEDAVKQEEAKDGNSGQEEKKKAHGWRAFFERYIKHEEPEMEDTYEPEPVKEAEHDQNEDAEDSDEDAEDPDDGMFTAGEEDLSIGELNPYTGHEYESNSVRMNKKRIGYVQVYDRGKHQWTDMTEWAFLGYQERKKALLGKDYVPPIYLD